MKIPLIILILIASMRALAQDGPMPPVIPIKPRPVYFTATSFDANGNQSSFSNETIWTNWPNKPVLLTWTASTGPVVGYTLYWGYQSHVYTMSRVVGNVTSFQWPPPPPPAIWQHVVTWLKSTNLLTWVTNQAVTCTVTGALPGAVGFERIGKAMWIRVQ